MPTAFFLFFSGQSSIISHPADRELFMDFPSTKLITKMWHHPPVLLVVTDSPSPALYIFIFLPQ
jgi:hypothetical protein